VLPPGTHGHPRAAREDRGHPLPAADAGRAAAPADKHGPAGPGGWPGPAGRCRSGDHELGGVDGRVAAGGERQRVGALRVAGGLDVELVAGPLVQEQEGERPGRRLARGGAGRQPGDGDRRRRRPLVTVAFEGGQHYLRTGVNRIDIRICPHV
jgi:hypothetical protein